jgi:hypothetical protein
MYLSYFTTIHPAYFRITPALVVKDFVMASNKPGQIITYLFMLKHAHMPAVDPKYFEQL